MASRLACIAMPSMTFLVVQKQRTILYATPPKGHGLQLMKSQIAQVSRTEAC